MPKKFWIFFTLLTNNILEAEFAPKGRDGRQSFATNKENATFWGSVFLFFDTRSKAEKRNGKIEKSHLIDDRRSVELFCFFLTYLVDSPYDKRNISGDWQQITDDLELRLYQHIIDTVIGDCRR